MDHITIEKIYKEITGLYVESESKIEAFKIFLEKGILKMCHSILLNIEEDEEKYSSYAFSINYYSDNYKGERFSIKKDNKELRTFVFNIYNFNNLNLDENFIDDENNSLIKILNGFYDSYLQSEKKEIFSLKDYFKEKQDIKILSFLPKTAGEVNFNKYKENENENENETINNIQEFQKEFILNNNNTKKYYQIYYDYLTKNLINKENNYTINQYAFSFVNKITKKNLGNLVITTENIIDVDNLKLIYFIADYVISRIAETDNNISLKHANIKSAISAIMSRNMSHNLGSHVFYYTRQNLLNIYEEEKDNGFKYSKEIKGLSWFLHYVQERQDFIANINSGDRYIFGPLNLKQDVIDEIAPDAMDKRHLEGTAKKNKITKNYLLENIVKSEKISRHSEDDKSLADIQIEIKYEDKIFSTKENIFEKDFYNLELAVQGGQQSRHAFLIILENIIRNSAKHAFNKSENNELIITIDVKKSENIYDISIHDNTKNAHSVVELLNNALNHLTFIDSTNYSIDRSNKGLKEILVSILWLKGEDFGNIEELAKNKDILKIHENQDGNLTYTFSLPVFKKSVVLDSNSIISILKDEPLKDYASIFIVNDKTLLDTTKDRRSEINTILYNYLSKCLNVSFPDYEENTFNIKLKIIELLKSKYIEFNDEIQIQKTLIEELSEQDIKSILYFQLKKRLPHLVKAEGGARNEELWKKMFETNFSLNSNNMILFDRSSEKSNNNNVSLILDKEVKTTNGYKIYFNNHISKNKESLKKNISKVKPDDSLIYENISGANQAFNLMQKFTVSNNDNLNNKNDDLYWNILLNYETKIVIVDERLSFSPSTLFDLEEDLKLFSEGKITCEDMFDKSGLINGKTAFCENIKTEKDFLSKLNDNYNSKRNDEKRNYELPDLDKYIDYLHIPKKGQNIYEKFKFQQNTFPFNLDNEKRLLNSLPNIQENPFLDFLTQEEGFYHVDFFTIHVGLIDKIKEKKKINSTRQVIKEILLKNKIKPRYVCVHSGRGGLNDKNDHINFIPFSILQRCFEDSKFLLSEFFYNNQYIPL